jgi:hypothetical protein
MNFLQKSHAIKQEADKFLAKKKITEILSKYGEVIFTGSYATDLMTWRDLDIQLLIADSLQSQDVFLAIIKDLLPDHELDKVTLMNSTPNKYQSLPLGLYLGLDYKITGIKWKVDIWTLEETYLVKDLALKSLILEKLTPDLKELILKVKFTLMADSTRVPQGLSYNIYQAIFQYNLTKEEEVFDFLEGL